MGWPAPTFSKNRVRKAGKKIAETYNRDEGLLAWGFNIPTEEFEVADNWRASHGAVLNTAQAWLRRLDKDQRPVVGQRLKRFNTIIDKLHTGRSRDLSTMHDIAGVRAIFRSEDHLHSFRSQMEMSRAKHRRTNDRDRFDYISCPKDTGYRGIHDVYERQVASISGAPWNGLKFEVQLRTAVQHAWATAVEIYDSTAAARFKFQKSSAKQYRQFQIISEIFARVHENRASCIEGISDVQLVEELRELESETRMVSMIEGLKVAEHHGAIRQNSILQRTNDGKLVVHSYISLGGAIRAISQIESAPETVNAVLVGASTPQQIRDAFRNYFDDTSDFVDLLDSAVKQVV